MLSPAIASADRYGFCDDGGCGSGDLGPIEFLLGIILWIGVLVWIFRIPWALKIAFLGTWFGGAAILKGLGTSDDAVTFWLVIGFVPAFFVTGWVAEKTHRSPDAEATDDPHAADKNEPKDGMPPQRKTAAPSSTTGKPVRVLDLPHPKARREKQKDGWKEAVASALAEKDRDKLYLLIYHEAQSRRYSDSPDDLGLEAASRGFPGLASAIRRGDEL